LAENWNAHPEREKHLYDFSPLGRFPGTLIPQLTRCTFVQPHFTSSGKRPRVQFNTASRRLAAIMFSDICGYSRMMNVSEERAMRVLERHNQLHLLSSIQTCIL